MTNNFQIQKKQLPKRRINPFEMLDFRFWYLFVFCFLSFVICINLYARKINN
jgi:hypothetical protein